MNTLKIFNKLGQSMVLREKKHYSQALKLLSSLKNRLEEQEQFDINIYGLTIMNSIFEYQNDKDVSMLEKKGKNYALIEENARLLQELAHIQGIHNEMRQIIYRPIGIDDNRKEALEQLFNNKLSKIQFEHIKGARAKYYYLHSYYIINAYTKDDFLENRNILENMKGVLLSNDKIFKKRDLFVTINNLCGYYLETDEKEKFRNCMKEQDEILALMTSEPITYLSYWKYIRWGEFYTYFLEETMPEQIKKEMLDFLEIPDALYEHKLGIIYRLACYHFLRKQYIESKEILDKIFLTMNIKAESFYFLPIRLIYIIVLSELEEYNFAQKELLSLKRKMKRDETNTLLMDKLFQYLANFVKEPIDAGKKKYHLKELLTLKEYEEKHAFFIKKIFIILKWAEQEIS